MRTLQRTAAILFMLPIWTGCGDSQQPDISGVADPYCEQMVACEWYDDFAVCQQAAESFTAALIHVYGQECGEVFLDALHCETFLECDDFSGCDEEWGLFDAVCS